MVKDKNKSSLRKQKHAEKRNKKAKDRRNPKQEFKFARTNPIGSSEAWGFPPFYREILIKQLPAHPISDLKDLVDVEIEIVWYESLDDRLNLSNGHIATVSRVLNLKRSSSRPHARWARYSTGEVWDLQFEVTEWLEPTALYGNWASSLSETADQQDENRLRSVSLNYALFVSRVGKEATEKLYSLGEVIQEGVICCFDVAHRYDPHILTPLQVDASVFSFVSFLELIKASSTHRLPRVPRDGLRRYLLRNQALEVDLIKALKELQVEICSSLNQIKQIKSSSEYQLADFDVRSTEKTYLRVKSELELDEQRLSALDLKVAERKKQKILALKQKNEPLYYALEDETLKLVSELKQVEAKHKDSQRHYAQLSREHRFSISRRRPLERQISTIEEDILSLKKSEKEIMTNLDHLFKRRTELILPFQIKGISYKELIS